jgi:Rrf2 family transcriptional regulator, cysteine metabolism repressor
MLTFTTKSRYGLSAILEMAKNFGNPPLNVKEIAARHNISPQYLEQVLSRLIKPGLIKAVRGQKGGFVLARPPQEIALIDVLEALEGSLAMAQSLPQNEGIQEYAAQAESSLRQVLDVSLSDVLNRQAAHAVMFHI